MGSRLLFDDKKQGILRGVSDRKTLTFINTGWGVAGHAQWDAEQTKKARRYWLG